MNPHFHYKPLGEFTLGPRPRPARTVDFLNLECDDPLGSLVAVSPMPPDMGGGLFWIAQLIGITACAIWHAMSYF